MFDYLIIGAGITGVTIGRLLQLKNIKNFIILEAEDSAGGLCKTIKIDGNILDIGGGHFLCSKFPNVYSFIFSHIPEDNFNFYDRISKVKVYNYYIDYPLETNLWQLPRKLQIKFIISIYKNKFLKYKSKPNNFDEWIRFNLGDKIANLYMIPYNKKIWGLDPKKMDINWLPKIPVLNSKEIIKSLFFKKSLRYKIPSHVGFYYPKKNGFQIIFDSIFNHIKDKVILKNPIQKLRFKGSYWEVNDEFLTKNIINTAPWPELIEPLNVPDRLKMHFEKLKANSIVISLWEKNYNNNWHWCYIPDMDIPYHREFYIKNFSPSSKANSVYTETNISYWSNCNKFSKRNKEPIFEHINKYAYPIPLLGSQDSINEILNYYKKLRIFGVGRWGQWQYFNADVCILEAMKFINNLNL